MCRIAFFPPRTDVKDPLVMPHLGYLVEYQGGDGAGIGTWSGDKQVMIKGMQHDGKSLGRILKKRGNETGWLFHARLASVGPKVNELTQPMSAGDELFVHNGHWSGWDNLYWPMLMQGKIDVKENVSDSLIMSRMIEATGRELLQRMASGVFVTFRKGADHAVLTLQSGAFAYSSLPGGGFVYSSSFPETWPMKVYEFKSGTVAKLGDMGPEIVFGGEPFETKGTFSSKGGSRSWQGHAGVPAHYMH